MEKAIQTLSIVNPCLIKQVFSKGSCFFFASFLNELLPGKGSVMEVTRSAHDIGQMNYDHFVYYDNDSKKLYDINGEFKEPFVIVNGHDELFFASNGNAVYVRVVGESEMEALKNSSTWNQLDPKEAQQLCIEDQGYKYLDLSI